jgi:hypothetical protein
MSWNTSSLQVLYLTCALLLFWLCDVGLLCYNLFSTSVLLTQFLCNLLSASALLISLMAYSVSILCSTKILTSVETCFFICYLPSIAILLKSCFF